MPRKASGSPPQKTTTVSGLYESMRADVHFKKFKSTCRSLIKPINLSKYSKELEELHNDLKVRSVTTKDVESLRQGTIITAVLQNQSYRSRTVAIKVRVHKIKAEIEGYVNALYSYLISQYASELKSAGLSTVSDRDNLISSLYSAEMQWLGKAGTVVTIADLMIDDYDQAGWALQRITKTLELMQAEKYTR